MAQQQVHEGMFEDEAPKAAEGGRNSTGLAVSSNGTTTEMIRSAETGATAAAERARAMVEAKYALAMRRPRNVDNFRTLIAKECRRPSFAEVARYSKPVGGDSVEGFSVRFAEACHRLFGNLDVQSAITVDDPYKRVIRLEVTDLETIASVSAEIVVEKTVERSKANGRKVIAQRKNSRGYTVFVVEATEDELIGKTESLRSRIFRNLVMKMIPGDILDECRRIVEKTMNDADAADPDAARKRICDSFAEVGVMPTQLSDFLGHGLDTMTPLELRNLRLIFASIRSGEATWTEYVEAKETDKNAKDGKPSALNTKLQEQLAKSQAKAKGNGGEQKQAPADPEKDGR
jgi:hypothetical protein